MIFIEGNVSGCCQLSCHCFLPWESPVVERVHVNDLLCLDDSRRLWLLFETTLALQRDTQFIHNGTAERSLKKKTREGGQKRAVVNLYFTLHRQMQTDHNQLDVSWNLDRILCFSCQNAIQWFSSTVRGQHKIYNSSEVKRQCIIVFISFF